MPEYSAGGNPNYDERGQVIKDSSYSAGGNPNFTERGPSIDTATPLDLSLPSYSEMIAHGHIDASSYLPLTTSEEQQGLLRSREGYYFLPSGSDITRLNQRLQNYRESTGLIEQRSEQQRQNLLNQQAGLKTSYARERNDLINSFQDALDNLRLGIEGTKRGLQTAEARRGLYNAAGDVSGIGQNIATVAYTPANIATTRLATRQASALGSLDERERVAIQNVDTQLSGLSTMSAQQKLDLRNSLIKTITENARRQKQLDLQEAGVTGTYQGEPTRQAQTNVQASLNLEERQREFDTRIAQQAKNYEGRSEQTLAKAGFVKLTNQKAIDKAKREGHSIVKIGNWKYFNAQAEARLKNEQRLASGLPPGFRSRQQGNDYTHGIGKIESSRTGLAFFDAKGKPITAAQYARANNKSISDVLRTSQDPGDQEYIHDHDALMGNIGSLIPSGPNAGKVLTQAMVDRQLKESYPYVYGTSR